MREEGERREGEREVQYMYIIVIISFRDIHSLKIILKTLIKHNAAALLDGQALSLTRKLSIQTCKNVNISDMSIQIQIHTHTHTHTHASHDGQKRKKTNNCQ